MPESPASGLRMLFVISAPRSGSTMLERMLEAHSMIQGGPEPHLLTPLAHLGVWDKVDKAPYDHILAAEAQRLFVSQLPHGENDYWEACRAYCDVLYGRFTEAGGKPVCLDKTPAYALILPFITKVFPDAKYIVLTRHPLATFSSYANSFFDGDYAAAQSYNPILNRYVPAIAAFLRQEEVPYFHVRYEDLVEHPERRMKDLYDFAGVPYEPETIEYGNSLPERSTKGLGDPIGVKQHVRPTTASVTKWASELASDTRKRSMMEKVIAQLDPDDLAACGYPIDGLWQPLEDVGGKSPGKRPAWSRYRIQRLAILRLRARARRGGMFRRSLEKLRLACDVLLRE